ncbi:GNAT family N-acetyltransferase [Cohnella fermenti]|uniref:GNAT family N-acetyltransferase n=1 Tax=Cohnella fermenti TaxID=2565925 RepID=A0A4S4BMM1_9BACL|nr:GNAT family N-acetyltransferase [Cohnella fermenti]THF75515.1 GNAT family N-acetyltransferase [Cohnella fermenti]
MAGIVKLVAPERLGEAAALADRVFRGGETFMGRAFPAIFDGRLACSYGVHEGDRLAAFLGLVPSELRIGPASVPLFSIGAVCTAPESRGRGYASALLGEAFRHIDEAGGSLLFVSGALPIYRRSGCHPFGGIRRYRVNGGMAGAETGAGAGVGTSAGTSADMEPAFEWRELLRADLHRLQALAERSEARYGRSLAETAALLHSASLAGIYRMEQKTLLGLRDGKATAFIVIAVPGEKPAETAPFVVEWGGDAADAVRLMAESVVHYSPKDGLEAFVPWQERELMRALEQLANREGTAEVVEAEAKHSGTVRVGSANRLWEQLRPYLAARDSGASAQVEVADAPGDSGAADVTAAGETRRLDAERLISFLFDPASEARSAFARSDLLARLLPIPLPYPSGLSFV